MHLGSQFVVVWFAQIQFYMSHLVGHNCNILSVRSQTFKTANISRFTVRNTTSRKTGDTQQYSMQSPPPINAQLTYRPGLEKKEEGRTKGLIG